MNIQEHREALAALEAQRAQLTKERVAAKIAPPKSGEVTIQGLEAMLNGFRHYAPEATDRDYFREDELLVQYMTIHAEAINAEIRARQQGQTNAREAAANHKALCGSCFTVHAGECI